MAATWNLEAERILTDYYPAEGVVGVQRRLADIGTHSTYEAIKSKAYRHHLYFRDSKEWADEEDAIILREWEHGALHTLQCLRAAGYGRQMKDVLKHVRSMRDAQVQVPQGAPRSPRTPLSERDLARLRAIEYILGAAWKRAQAGELLHPDGNRMSIQDVIALVLEGAHAKPAAFEAVADEMEAIA